MAHRAGRHYLQIPGPTNVPDRVLRAIDMPTMDHRGPDFAALGHEVLDGLKHVFQTKQPVVIYPASGTGAWEAALVNTLSPGDKVLMFETGHFATLWHKMATKLGLAPEFVATDWRRGADPAARRGEAEGGQGARHQGRVRRPQRDLDRRDEPHRRNPEGDRRREPPRALSRRYDQLARLDRLPPRRMGRGRDRRGLTEGPDAPARPLVQRDQREGAEGFAVVQAPEVVLGVGEIIANNKTGYFPYTPATNLLYGLREALRMLREEGLENVFARHDRHAEATRRAARGWGLEILCAVPEEYSSSLTALMTPAGHDADHLRKTILEAFDMSLGTGLGKLAGKVFRIGHLGDFNDLTLAGTLAGVEMGLELAGVPHRKGGAQAAMDYLVECARRPARKAA